MGVVGVNTCVVLDLAMASPARLGTTGGSDLRYGIAAVIMIVQLALAIFGFYAIRGFEKYTVPLTVVVKVVMTGLALFRADIHWADRSRPSTNAPNQVP
jgi:NCS1 family nucleobase:cation symporter-1